MPRVIFKCPYLKAGVTSEHRRFYVKYIATREGVRKIDDTRKLLPATENQKRTAARILREFRTARERCCRCIRICAGLRSASTVTKRGSRRPGGSRKSSRREGMIRWRRCGQSTRTTMKIYGWKSNI